MPVLVTLTFAVGRSETSGAERLQALRFTGEPLNEAKAGEVQAERHGNRIGHSPTVAGRLGKADGLAEGI